MDNLSPKEGLSSHVKIPNHWDAFPPQPKGWSITPVCLYKLFFGI